MVSLLGNESNQHKSKSKYRGISPKERAEDDAAQRREELSKGPYQEALKQKVRDRSKGASMLIPLSETIALRGYVIASDVVAKKKKWMQQMTKSKKFEEGALRKYFGLKKKEKVTMGMIDKELDKLEKKYPDGGYSKPDLELQKRLQAARNMMSR